MDHAETPEKDTVEAAERRPVSLATLSAHLGLSQAAISRVLSGAAAAKSIPVGTQQRIFAAAEALNYRPNLLARSLRRGRSMTIGVLVPELSEGYVTLVLSGLEPVLLKAGYVFILISHHHRAEVMQQSEAVLTERAVDGLIAIDTTFPCTSKLPTVTVSCPHEHPVATNIVLNHVRAAELALGHLVELGHHAIAVIKGQSFSSDTEARWQAICSVADALQLTIAPEAVDQLEDDSPTHEPGYLAMRRMLARGARFTAVFAFNDISAIGCIRALREVGIRVPQDVSVVGFDDIRSAAYQNPALTTVRQPLKKMGELAARRLLQSIASPGLASLDGMETVEPELVVRESSSAPPARCATETRTGLGAEVGADLRGDQHLREDQDARGDQVARCQEHSEQVP